MYVLSRVLRVSRAKLKAIKNPFFTLTIKLLRELPVGPSCSHNKPHQKTSFWRGNALISIK